MRAEDEKSQQSLGHKLWNRTLLTTVALHSVALHCFMGLQRSRANKRPQTWQRCSLACPVPPLPNPTNLQLFTCLLSLAFLSSATAWPPRSSPMPRLHTRRPTQSPPPSAPSPKPSRVSIPFPSRFTLQSTRGKSAGRLEGQGWKG